MLLRQTLLYLPSQLAGPAMQFVFAVLWTHWLTQDDYGHLTFLIAGQELIFLCCVSWWSLFVLRYFGGAGQANARGVLDAEPGILEATCLPQIVLNIGVLAMLGELGNVHLVVASTAYVIGRSFVMYFGERVRTKANIALYTIAQTGSLAAGGLLGFLFVVYLAPTASSVLSGFAISHLAVALWLVSKLGIRRSGEKFNPAVVTKAVGFGLPLVVAGIINWINLNGIRVVTEEMGGATAVGLLAVGWGLGQRLSTTAAMFVTTAAFPLAARSIEQGSRSDAMKQMRGGGTLLVGLVLPAAAGLWMITPPFVHLTISEPFRPITLAIMPLAVAIGAIRNIRVHYADAAFILFERTGLSVLVNSVEAVLMIALCTAGYAHSGIYGAVLGAGVASSAGAALAFVLARRFGLPMPIADWGRIVVATVAMMALLEALTGVTARLSEIAQIGVAVIVGALTYFVALACLFPLRLQHLLRASRRPAPKATAAFDPVPGEAGV